MPNFEYFLSCGIPGKLEGERYKKTPELVRSWVAQTPKFQAPRTFLVFKRWDQLEDAEEPEVVIFFAQLEVLSGLFTLANFDVADPNGVFTPFGVRLCLDHFLSLPGKILRVSARRPGDVRRLRPSLRAAGCA